MPAARLMFLGLVLILSAAAPTRAEGIPADAEKVLKEYEANLAKIQAQSEADLKAIQKKSEADQQAAYDKCKAALKEVQDAYTKAAKLDEAIAVRDRIAALKPGTRGDVMKDPGSMNGYGGEIGRVLFIETVGSTSGTLYGSDFYTCDSAVSLAAVHGGVLKEGEKGIVKVTIIEPQSSFKGSGKNGVVSREWFGANLAAYKVERAYGAGKTAESKTTNGIDKKDVIADPGNLSGYIATPNKVLLIEVTGSNTQTIWGTGTYTSDSGLATAAVHAGVLKVGEKGIVKVTTLLPQLTYASSTRNGVTSSPWSSSWFGSYKVEAAGK